MASFKPHPAHSGKPKNQGSSATPHVQKPKMSGKPSRAPIQDAPQPDQSKRRGVHPQGTRGSGRGTH